MYKGKIRYFFFFFFLNVAYRKISYRNEKKYSGCSWRIVLFQRKLFQIFSPSAHSRFSAQIRSGLPALFGNMSLRPIRCFRKIERFYAEKKILNCAN